MKKLYYSFLSILMIVINSIAFADVVTYTDEESRNIIWGMNSHSHGISEFDSQKFFINICIFTIIGFIILGLINKIVKNKYLKKIVSIVGIILIFCFSTGKIETIYKIYILIIPFFLANSANDFRLSDSFSTIILEISLSPKQTNLTIKLAINEHKLDKIIFGILVVF